MATTIVGMVVGRSRRSVRGRKGRTMGISRFPAGERRISFVAKRDRTAPEEDLVRLYLTDIGRHKLLSKADEATLAEARLVGLEAADELGRTNPSPTRRRRLGRLVREGEAAELRFVESNLRLVVSLAKRYTASGVPLLDLVQEGNF